MAKRRLIVSFLVALGALAVYYAVRFILPAPERALYNLRANTGSTLFFTAIFFAVNGVPAWLLAFAIVTVVGPLRSGLRRAPPEALGPWNRAETGPASDGPGRPGPTLLEGWPPTPAPGAPRADSTDLSPKASRS